MSAIKFMGYATAATAVGWTISSVALVVFMGHLFADVPFEEDTLVSHAQQWHDKARWN